MTDHVLTIPGRMIVGGERAGRVIVEAVAELDGETVVLPQVRDTDGKVILYSPGSPLLLQPGENQLELRDSSELERPFAYRVTLQLSHLEPAAWPVYVIELTADLNLADVAQNDLPPTLVPVPGYDDGEVRALIGQAHDLAAGAVAAGAAAAQAPAYLPAAALSHRAFEADLSRFNWRPANTRRLRAALGRAAAGAGVADLLVLGDSTSDSFIGTGYDQTHMWPIVLRDRLAKAGIPSAGSGFVQAGGVSPTPDPRWSGAGWTRTDGNMFGYATTPGAALTFTTVDAPGTNVDLWYLNTSSPFDWAIKNGAGVTIDSGTVATTGATSIGVLRRAGLTGATSLVVTNRGQITLVTGAAIRIAAGVLVHNAARFGTKVTGPAGWDDSSTFYYCRQVAASVVAVPDVVFCCLGLNDLAQGAAVADVIAGLTRLRATFPSSDFVLIGSSQPSAVSPAAWQVYLSALYTLADSLDVPLLDLNDRWGGFAAADAVGLMGDGTHPSAAAQRDWGLLVSSACQR